MGRLLTILFIITVSLNVACNRGDANRENEVNGKYLKVNGHKLWVETLGKGEPLFLISGGPGMSHGGMHSFDGLSDSCMLVFIDNFGRGKSDRATSPTEYSIKQDVLDIEGIRKALGYEKINLLGHSYGSEVAQLYALEYGQHVDHLIVAHGFYSGQMWQESNDNWNYIFTRQMPELWDSLMVIRSKGHCSSEKIHYELYNQFPLELVHAYCPENKFVRLDSCSSTFNEEVYYQILGDDGDFVIANDISKYDIRADLSKLYMPVLIIAGRFDRSFTPKLSLEYKKYCPQAKFAMLEHSGHNSQIDEPKIEFAVINDFLSSWKN